MTSVKNSRGQFSVTAYRGDAKTLLAFNLDKASTKNLAGFTIECTPDGQPAYYLHNQLQFQTPADHTQDPKEPPNSSINAPIHKFRWVHVPGQVHQGIDPYMGMYTYTVTPRYFDKKNSLTPLDQSLSVSVQIQVAPFEKGCLRLGFARGFVQSQAFVYHFGKDAPISPNTNELLFDTSQPAGKNAQGQQYTYADEYRWLGFTARSRIFDLLTEVQQDATLHLDMFAYDLNEPDLMRILLDLAGQGRIRVILDNAALHHDATGKKSEDCFEQEFKTKMRGNSAILRGKFGRFSHDKIFIVSDPKGPSKVLTGSTNFSVTGIYVNSNHVLVFEDPQVATLYSKVFEESWSDNVNKTAFQKSTLSSQVFNLTSQTLPPTDFTFSPHTAPDVNKILSGIKDRINVEAAKKAGGSVLFAVMEMSLGSSPVYDVLNNIHQDQSIFSFGISDSPQGICLYKPGTATGVLVSGKPASTVLPPPFNQIRNVGAGHQVHHKFVICGFNQPDAVTYCGSSNLAGGGEENNGDNLLAIHDGDVATVFAIEALDLVDHFNFLDKYATGGKGSTGKKKPAAKVVKPAASPKQAAVNAGWFLATNDTWTKPYFDPKDLKYVDRTLFG